MSRNFVVHLFLLRGIIPRTYYSNALCTYRRYTLALKNVQTIVIYWQKMFKTVEVLSPACMREITEKISRTVSIRSGY